MNIIKKYTYSNRVATFESFVNDSIISLIDEFDQEILSLRMRIGPSIDKLPWAMKTVVYEFLKDRIMEENSSTNNIDIDAIIFKLEDQKEDIKKRAMDLLIGAGMGKQEVEDTYKIGYKAIKLNNNSLKARPIKDVKDLHNDINDVIDNDSSEKTVESNFKLEDKEFKSARNKGRNIMRKFLDPNYSSKKESHNEKIKITNIKGIKYVKNTEVDNMSNYNQPNTNSIPNNSNTSIKDSQSPKFY